MGRGGNANQKFNVCVKNEEIDSVSKLLVKFSFICRSYSQVITGCHTIFKLIYIAMQDIQNLDNLDG